MKMTESGQDKPVGALYAIVMDVNDLKACGKFWSRVLGTEILYQDEGYLRLGRRGERPTLLLQRVPERHKEKNRVHIDLDVTDLDEAVNRVLGLGGRKLRPVAEYGIEWVVMADPDGNEFCLIKHSQ
jgi:predicted enzyme related to lactoylglutathione lyase